MPAPLVGIIANPASGRDIRRLAAHGAVVFDNNEKAAIVRRMLFGLEAAGVTEVLYMPERDFGIVPRALDGQDLQLAVSPLEMPVLGVSADSTHAASLLAERGAGCILTLGGDGTNRAVAKGCGAAPLIPISTGTNNVFPTFLEGTIAGLAAGFVAKFGASEQTVRRAPRLEVRVSDGPVESALVDVAISSLPFVGARALWDLSVVREVVLARVAPAAIGLSALGGALLDGAAGEVNEATGMHITLGPGGRQALAALAPGLVQWVEVTAYRRLEPGAAVSFQPGAGTVALDGEREIELAADSRVEVRLGLDGPFVVDVPATLAAAARAGHLQRTVADDVAAG
ncbi:MAG TPA: NAD(+)/NADH kinase [Ktedonobacterales bacterium]|nr:NAD(+)/NADH kinase [Ktedonobacterales bacterium]